ncbi:sugar lactone lactonase YvrE [Kribbella aluminosa]|uniref:Sugar lactone lactonase YvrE n=1 Tax=Kribbella aluminosa TaxID=416017 RepID=A0ABS4UZ36_9ACTN|nr:hypothetical protein [Kribbella aluminosa]MBP2356799.1 sugar lactone lactonase YvrE [Kribbella aluminosa]
MAPRSLPQRAVRAVGESPLVERLAHAQEVAYGPLIDGARRTFLHTDVLGHSLHPSLTDVTTGCWLGTSLLDPSAATMALHRGTARRASAD